MKEIPLTKGKDGNPPNMKSWKASIEYFPGKDNHIGMYSTEEEAYNAYRVITNLLTGEILPEISQSGD